MTAQGKEAEGDKGHCHSVKEVSYSVRRSLLDEVPQEDAESRNGLDPVHGSRTRRYVLEDDSQEAILGNFVVLMIYKMDHGCVNSAFHS